MRGGEGKGFDDFRSEIEIYNLNAQQLITPAKEIRKPALAQKSTREPNSQTPNTRVEIGSIRPIKMIFDRGGEKILSMMSS